MPDTIPGNNFALRELQTALASGEALTFVGAGASAGLYPLWPQLIRGLAEEAVDRGLADVDQQKYWLKMASSQPQQAVRLIKAALGGGTYAQVVRNLFSPRAGSDGNRFTRVHAALLTLPFRGHITTNFDPGLLEARRALRPDSHATGAGTWKDTDIVYRWQTGDIFREQPCPVLFAHGIYDRADTLVLEADEYRQAYQPGAFRSMFEALWARMRLVFVGFSFADAWLTFLADEVLSRIGARQAGAPRHFAIIGLHEGDPYTADMRRAFQDQFHVNVVFYRIRIHPDGSELHDDLHNVLAALGPHIPGATTTATAGNTGVGTSPSTAGSPSASGTTVATTTATTGGNTTAAGTSSGATSAAHLAVLKDLREALAQVFSRTPEIELILEDSGINVGSIHLGGAAQEVWRDALKEAQRVGRLPYLLEEVIRKAPGIAAFRDARARLSGSP